MINHKKFLDGSKKNDIYMSLSTNMHKDMFYKIFQKNRTLLQNIFMALQQTSGYLVCSKK